MAGDARGYSWKAFEPGHTISVQHGAYSPKVVDPVAAEIEREARARPSWPAYLDGGDYDFEIGAWANAEAVCTILRNYLAKLGATEYWLTEREDTDVDEDQVTDTHRRRRSGTKRIQSALEMLRRWEATAANSRKELGLTPLARARLGRDVTQATSNMDLAKYWQTEDPVPADDPAFPNGGARRGIEAP